MTLGRLLRCLDVLLAAALLLAVLDAAGRAAA